MGNRFDSAGILKDTEFYLGLLSPEQVAAIHRSALGDLGRLAAAETVCFVIGSYDQPQKERLYRACDLLEEHGMTPFLLDEIDPGMEGWRNFYVKFRVLLTRVDHVIAIVEDNDGGHELELGEADLSDTYVLKRDYTAISLEDGDEGPYHDIEREKYDAMIATMFDLLDTRDHLYEWTTLTELDERIKDLAADLD